MVIVAREHDAGRGRLVLRHPLDHGVKLRAIDEREIPALRELDRGLGEAAGGDDEATGGAVSGHRAVQLPDDRNAHRLGAPLLALDEVLLRVLPQDHVHAAVGAAAGLDDAVPLHPECLADEHLELTPRHRVEGVRRRAHASQQLTTLPPAEHRRQRGDEKEDRQEVLTGGGQRAGHGLDQKRAVTKRDRTHRTAHVQVQCSVARPRKHHTAPPGQQRCEFDDRHTRTVIPPAAHRPDSPMLIGLMSPLYTRRIWSDDFLATLQRTAIRYSGRRLKIARGMWRRMSMTNSNAGGAQTISRPDFAPLTTSCATSSLSTVSGASLRCALMRVRTMPGRTTRTLTPNGSRACPRLR